MIRFVALRLLRALVTVLAVMTFAFVVLRMSGDPAEVLMGPDVPQDAIDAFRTQWGLDAPLWQQYFSYLGAILSGDFGMSMRDRSPAIQLVIERIPATLQLTIPALLLKLGMELRGFQPPDPTETFEFALPEADGASSTDEKDEDS